MFFQNQASFFNSDHGPWWFDSFSSFLGAILGAVVALFTIFWQSRILKIKKEQEDKLNCEENKYFLSIAIVDLLKYLDLKVVDIRSINLCEIRERKIRNFKPISHYINRIKNLNEQELLKNFTKKLNSLAEREIVVDKVFTMFTALDQLHLIEKDFDSLLKQFVEQHQKQTISLNKNKIVLIKKLRLNAQLAYSGKELLIQKENQTKKTIILNPLTHILNIYSSSEELNIVNSVTCNLIKPIKKHLFDVNVQSEPVIDEIYEFIDMMGENCYEILRLEDLYFNSIKELEKKMLYNKLKLVDTIIWLRDLESPTFSSLKRSLTTH